jgi:murein DD-endopeptidase MepM/ murein hydrolase activator NlpD
MSKQTRILQRREGNYRRIINGLESTKFLLGQQVENYREALDDLETQQRITKAYSAPVGPQPMESPTPWAATGPGDVGNEQGFTPRLPAEKLSQGGFLNTPYPARFSEGTGGYPGTPIPGLAKGGVNASPNFAEKMLQPGIYDNPTIGTLPPNSAVIPLNRNSGKELMGQYDTQQYIQALGETMFKPINALLGGALANLGDILKDLGPFAGYFSAGLKSLLNPLSSLLKLPANIILDILGTQKDEDGERSSFYKMWKQLLVDNNLIFPGSSIKDLDKEQLEGEIAKDIYGIGPKGEGLRYIGGTNVSMSNLPAWIPMPKSEYGKVGYVSGFGWRGGRMHSGIDLDGDPGIKIISPFAGTVYDLNRGAVEGDKNAGGGYGNLVGIQHDQPKIFTYYGHLRDVSNSLKVGSKVSAGEVIGTMGNTGHSYGSHLHWEVRQSKHGGQVDPAAWTRSVNKPAPAAAEPKDGEQEKDKDNKPQPLNKQKKERGGSVGKFEKGGSTITPSPIVNIIPEKTTQFSQPKPQAPKLHRTITTPVATPTKTQPKVYNIQAPQTGPSIQMMPTPTLKPQFIMIDIPTNYILESNEIRRMM